MAAYECPRCDWWVIATTPRGLDEAIAEHEAEKHRNSQPTHRADGKP